MQAFLEGKNIFTIEDFHNQIKEVLDFPDYYGKNYGALWDCLTGDLVGPIELEWKDFSVSKDRLGDDAINTIVSILNDAAQQYKIMTITYEN